MNSIYNLNGVIGKNELWVKYASLVRREAQRLQFRLPASVELNDLIQAGSIGLLAGIDDFDPTKGITLSNYVTQRIRWALIDELRERDWVPRRVRSNSRDIAAVIQRIEQRTGMAATEIEVAEEMGVTIREYHKMLADTNSSQLYSLEELQEEYSDGFEQLSSQHEKLDPLNDLMKKKLLGQISTEISALPEREQLLLNLYYQQDLNMKEVGVLLGITETRVSQLHSQAIKRLRARLDSTK
ncbi:MAG: RNA polymerase sigma factor FliA [Hafnia sp.]|uniref:RNA polymerase sigma factor n=1 Tax=Obesumbacterium proteus ATCC 12841 TaxID=1354268 RepID=A0AA91EI21_9GAMM|nr:RNA polymerase sigma factor FliA [Obesumbacterium proteus]AMO83557.1 RNA polymerase sigma factor FliA [Obesumbacterium proteus]KKI43525.1 flagellar biosynthesis sigma factor [Obesumbacterium proteus]MCE9883576.1 RNA polymerase sigma factor FliA [Obesumbacterium proteus]MCE9915177.1 RNA polymerase sigma factor FliA [Obesumbacterium proteus]MCE9927947.1 RNA polymerase sigma factor FliA [Obesumbacterium proteus]